MAIKIRVGVINSDVKGGGGTASHVREAQGLVDRLEPAERRLLSLVVEGYSLMKASFDLGLSLEETAGLKVSLMQKLGATRTADLVRVGLYVDLPEGD